MLAYACTTHKAQGSEWLVGIVIAEPSMVCDRSWIYTAISRAKKLCFVVGKPGDVEQMIRKQHMAKRQTFLVDKRPVAALQVLNQHLVVAQHDDAVLSADRIALGPQLARIAATDQKLVTRDANLFPFVTTGQNLSRRDADR